MLDIEPVDKQDWDAIWPIFRAVVAGGDTYAYDPATTKDQARKLWLENPAACYVARLGGEVVGTYFIKANQPGLGSHVCNAGYMVSAAARGQGVGRGMCLHSQTEALKLGFRSMQFNLVVADNPAVKLWAELGFETVGSLAGAFRKAEGGYVDALVMYKVLGKER